MKKPGLWDKLYHFSETRSSYVAYEPIEHDNFTWTAALSDSLLDPDHPLASVTNVGQLCDAQAELLKGSWPDYWTALRVNSRGSFEMGLLPYNSTRVPFELLDKKEPWDRCYAISRSVMELKSMNCDTKLPYLISYEGIEFIIPYQNLGRFFLKLKKKKGKTKILSGTRAEPGILDKGGPNFCLKKLRNFTLHNITELG